MRIIVQKFGGSSLAKKDLRQKAIRHILKAKDQGLSVVVVVSAMGRKGDPYATDSLLELIANHGPLETRELDLLLSCGEVISAATLCAMLAENGHPATVLTGGQAGILTNNDHTNAHIINIHPNRVLQELGEGKIVIVTGFQGMTKDGEVTTLGRGGSDTSATALGVALKAEMIDIFTDVNGIMTADPRLVTEALPLKKVTYNEICNLAYSGAKVIHPRAVEIAMQTQVPIRVRSTFTDDEGTLVTSTNQHEHPGGEINDRPVTGIAQVSNLTQIKVMEREGEFDLQLKVFKAMADHRISVDFINVNPMGVAYTVYDHQAEKAVRILKELGYEPEVRPHCAKISTVGAGIAGVPGIMAQIVEALTEEDIDIYQSADSHTTIWVLVRDKDMAKAVRALHRKFKLNHLMIDS